VNYSFGWLFSKAVVGKASHKLALSADNIGRVSRVFPAFLKGR